MTLKEGFRDLVLVVSFAVIAFFLYEAHLRIEALESDLVATRSALRAETAKEIENVNSDLDRIKKNLDNEVSAVRQIAEAACSDAEAIYLNVYEWGFNTRCGFLAGEVW